MFKKTLPATTEEQPVPADRLSFEPMPTESEEDYHVFAQFLESDPDHSPARWIGSRDLDYDQWIVKAIRNQWLRRRIDYWNYIIVRQRMKWVKMLDLYAQDILERRPTHLKRIEEAYKAETVIDSKTGEEVFLIRQDYDRAVRTANKDLETILRVIEVLSGSDKSITIINNAVGAVNVSKDIKDVTKAWDRLSGEIIEGASREIGTEKDS